MSRVDSRFGLIKGGGSSSPFVYRHGILAARLEFWRGARISLHVMTLVIMVGIALMVLISGKTLYTSHGYAWFVDHWPFTDRAWGTLFGILGLMGSLHLIVQYRVIRFVSATALGCGHATIAYGIWTVNPVSTGCVTYGVVAAASFAVILLIILEDW